MKIRRTTAETETEDTAETVVRGACSVCKVAHTACDGQRPCKRCVTIGKSDLCFDVEPKKRACGPCRAAHTACDSQRPCKRCVAAGRAEQCVNPQLRKKGRRTKRNATTLDTPTQSNSTTNAAKRPRLEEPEAVRVGGTGSPVLTKTDGLAASTSPPLSPLLPPPFPLSLPHPPLGTHQPDHFRCGQHITACCSESSLESVGYPERRSSSTTTSALLDASSTAQLSTVGIATSRSSPPFNYSPSSSEDSVGQNDPDQVSESGSGLHQLEPILSMFMKELRELKSTNELMARDFRSTTEELRREILTLHQHQQKMEKRLDAINQAVAMTSPPSLPGSPGLPHEIVTYSPSSLFTGVASPDPSFNFGLHPQPHSASMPSPFTLHSMAPSADSRVSRREILSYLPFLASYNLTSPDAPFVVDSLRKPFFALQIMESMPGEEFTPPIFVFANAAFCSLVRHPLHELLGCPLSKVSFPDEKVKRQLLSCISKSGRSLYLPHGGFQEAPPSSCSEVIRLSPLFLPRNGRIMRLSTRVQFFYNEHGRVKWKVCCVDGLEESGAIEMPINWLPGLPKWWTTLPLSLPNLAGISMNIPSPRIMEEIKEEECDASPLEEAFLSSFMAEPSPLTLTDDSSTTFGASTSSTTFSGSAPPPATVTPWANSDNERLSHITE